jgi:exonuclease III
MKQEQLINYININKINILCINETKLKQKMADNLYKNNDKIMSWWNCDDENSFTTGTGIIMTKDVAKYLQKITCYNGKMIQATFFLKEKSCLTILSIYNFTHDKEKKEQISIL